MKKSKKSRNHCGYRTFLELLGRFELPTSSLPTASEASIRCAARLSGAFGSKRDEVVACIFHCFRPLVSPCGSACGSRCKRRTKSIFPRRFVRQQWVKICTGVIKEKARRQAITTILVSMPQIHIINTKKMRVDTFLPMISTAACTMPTSTDIR